MQQTLAEQVQAFMDFKTYSPMDMAREVAKHQRDLPEEKRCKRQNIESLLSKNSKTVLYLPALAAAMGTTAEVLAAGTFRPDANGHAAPPPPGYPLPVTNLRPIYVVGRGSGGLMNDRVWSDGDYPVGATDQYAMLGSSDPNAFLAEVIGNSMWPKYESHNFALIEPNTEIDVEDVVLVRLHTGQTMLKRLLSRRHDITLGSFNDPEQFHFSPAEISWMYYAAHEVPRKKIKSRY